MCEPTTNTSKLYHILLR